MGAPNVTSDAVASLPPALRLVFDQGVRRRGETLIGGTPLRVLRLTPAGYQALLALQQGTDTSATGRALGRRLLDAGIAHPRLQRRERVTDVTVVVPVRDRLRELERCLAALEPGIDVVVVDDGSREREALAAVAARHGARLVHRHTPGGPAAARNAALDVVSSELIAFLDSDCVPARGWLHALAGHFEDPLVGAVAPRVRPLPDARRSAVQRYLAARSPLDMGRREARVEPGGLVSYVPAAALLIRRRALAWGFDHDLRYGEDVDLIWRLRDAGWRVRYDPRTTVAHQEPDTLRGALARRFRYGTSAAPLAARHPGRLAPAVLAPSPALMVMLALSGRRRAAAALAFQQSAALARRAAGLGLPPAWGVRWFAESGYAAILSVTRYVATFALPVAFVYAHRTRRPAALALLALPALDERRRRDTGGLDPFRWVALALADDAAYGMGVCWGAIRAGTAAPLIPRLTAGRQGRRRRAGVMWSARRRSAARDR
jgi:mycofactocin system glycosyltransferase